MELATAWTAVDAESLGNELRTIRENKGLTQEQIAYAAGITRNHYALLEAGQSSSRKPGEANPRISTLASIATALNVPLLDLLAPLSRLPHKVAVKQAKAILNSRDIRVVE